VPKKKMSLGIALAGLALAGAIGQARAQRIDPKRGKTLVVGAPRGASPTDRVDGARTGDARMPLPAGTLHVRWRRNVGLPIEAPPLVNERGEVIVVTARGDVVVLAPDGEERSNTSVGSAAAGPAALLSDGTAVFLTAANDAVGVRLGAVRFRTHLGGGRSAVSPLPLDDGGFAVATGEELVALDGEGNVVARARIDPNDPPAHALVGGPRAPGGAVYAVTGNGAVLAWVPATGREPLPVGAFAGPTDGTAILASDPGSRVSPVSLVAVVGGELVSLDLVRGTTAVRAVGSASGALAFLGPPSSHAGTVSLLGVSATRTIALSFDPSGTEVLHHAVAASLLPNVPDAGAALGQLPPHVGTLTDPLGAIAFALPSGEVGVASVSGSLDLVSDVCSRFGSPASSLATLGLRGGPAFAGMAPAAPSALVVACGGGVVARLESDFAAPP
jgi:hypothetical protein